MIEISQMLIALKALPNEIDDWDSWSSYLAGVLAEFSNTIDNALIMGAWSRRPAYAFAAGYQAALFKLYPQANCNKRYAFCVSEVKGNNPKAIEASITETQQGLLLNGEKSFVTGIDQADTLLVAAEFKPPQDQWPLNRKLIKLVLLESNTPGVSITRHDPLPFVPELSHGSVTLAKVAVDESQLFPGDGYSDYVKPFRTIEDLHVVAAMVGYWLGVGFTHEWPHEVLEGLLANWLQCRTLSQYSPKDYGTHLALGGMLEQHAQLLQRLVPHIDRLPDDLRHICQRDMQLVKVAEKARSLRLLRAWQQFNEV
jgi:acyl-CoA dehydrogenase